MKTNLLARLDFVCKKWTSNTVFLRASPIGAYIKFRSFAFSTFQHQYKTSLTEIGQIIVLRQDTWNVFHLAIQHALFLTAFPRGIGERLMVTSDLRTPGVGWKGVGGGACIRERALT